MKILITGGNGFIGNKLVSKLKKDTEHEIWVMSSRIEDADKKVVKADLLDRSRLNDIINGYDVVYHLAATGDETLPINELYKINVDGTWNVFDACLENSVKKVIYTSSVGIYGALEKLPGSEESPLNAVSPYERSKKEIEYYIPKYRERGLSIINIRPVIVYGPGSPMWNKIISGVEGGKIAVGNGTNKWPLVYISDIVQALVLALDNKNVINENIIVADNKAYRYKEIVREIQNNLGIKKVVNPYIPVSLLYILSFVNLTANKLLGVPYKVTKDKIKRFVRNREYSISKARRLLDYSPAYDLEKGMKITVDSYRSAGATKK